MGNPSWVCELGSKFVNDPWRECLVGGFAAANLTNLFPQKPDPVTTKKLCIITLTRIFRLTHSYQTLVREITTPCLPFFINICLNLISVKFSSRPTRELKRDSFLFWDVFNAFLELLPQHPSIFRPFSAQIHSVTTPLIGVLSHERFHWGGSIIMLAQRLFISLHHCAPKNIVGEEWTKACKDVIMTIHQTCDQLFRAVVEQWESVDSVKVPSVPIYYDKPAGDHSPNPLGISPWDGIYSGSQRLISLMGLLTQFMTTKTNSTVPFPIGSVLDVSSRLIAVAAPSSGKETGLANNIVTKTEVGREEKEALWGELPHIHLAAVKLITAVMRLGPGSIPATQSCLDQIMWAFESNKNRSEIRIEIYRAIRAALPLTGSAMSKVTVSALTSVLKTACQDMSVLPVNGSFTRDESTSINSNWNIHAQNADAFLRDPTSDSMVFTTNSSLVKAATRLLSGALAFLPIQHMSPSLRANIDRVAILTNQHSIMMASVLNPISAGYDGQVIPSIVPFLARSQQGKLDVEGLLRPRMPIISTISGVTLDDEEQSQEAENDVYIQELSTGTGKRPFSKDAENDEPKATLSKETYSEIQNKRVRVDDGHHSTDQPSSVQHKPSFPVAPIRTEATEIKSTAMAKTNDPGSLVPLSVDVGSKSHVVGDTPTLAGPFSISSRPTFATPADSDDNDHEIPALNIESDTDDD